MYTASAIIVTTEGVCHMTVEAVRNGDEVREETKTGWFATGRECCKTKSVSLSVHVLVQD
jgi:hypothetical protein